MKTKSKKKQTKQVILPKVPSKLIRLAIKDLEWVEDHPKTYVIDMGCWHEPNSHCSVCLAGSVMAHSLKTNPKKDVTPCMIPENEYQLIALNRFRCGEVRNGLDALDITKVPFRDRDFDSYYHDPSGFKAQLLKLANDLEKRGL